MTKKLIAIFITILLIVSLCACNDTQTDEESTSGKTIIIQSEETTGTDETEETSETEQTEETTESETETDDPNEIQNPDFYTYTTLETPETVYVLSATGAATLRAGDYTIITSLANGASLERTGVSNGANGFWSQVVHEGQTCYIATHLITTIQDLDEGFTEISKTLIKADGSLKIRIAPDTNSEVIGYISAGEEIKVVAENKDLGWYKIEFVRYGETEASEGYIVANPEYFEPEIDIEVPEGYAAYIDSAIAFAYPEDWVNLADSEQMKLDPVTGDNYSVIYEAYTEDHEVFFTLTDDIFAEVFVPMYASVGYTVTDYSVSQETKGETRVAVMSFTNTVEGQVMYQTQYVFVVNTNQVCTLTVTEVSADTTIAEDLYASLIIAE